MSAVLGGVAQASPAFRLHQERRRVLYLAKIRGLWIALVFVALALVALSRIAWLGAVEPGAQPLSMAQRLLPARGEIVDRNNVPLARAFQARALWFNPQAIGDGGAPLVKSPDAVAAALAAIFPEADKARLLRKLKAGKPTYLARRILPQQMAKVHALGEPALEYPPEKERFYPQGSLAAHVIGFVDADGQGKVGMEEALQDRLLDPAGRGEPVALSIDVRVQGALEDELMAGIDMHEAIGAAGVILDVETGEVMALASLPSFNPNRIDSDGAQNIFNRVTNQVYELGSTFKPLSVAAAIEAGTIKNLARRFQAKEPLKVGGHRIRDSHVIGNSLNVPESLIHSSNIVTAQIADELGVERLQKTMVDLGMSVRPQIELPARGYPLFETAKWSRIRNMTVSYGHGIAVTPLHLASAYAAMVNGGLYRPATLMKREPGEFVEGKRVFSPATSAKMRQMLRMIVVYGTGRKADADGFRVGGKTGSAEKPGAGGYQRTSLVSTFAAAFPMDRPRYVIIAMFDEPKGNASTYGQRTAGWNAAPAVGRIVSRIGPMLGVEPDATRDIDLSDLKPLVVTEG